MNNWFEIYHHMLLLRLLALAVVFGVLWPGLWLLVTLGVRAAQGFATRPRPASTLTPRDGALR